MMYSGVIATVIGNIRPAANSEYMRRAAGERRSGRARSWPSTPRTTTPMVVTRPQITELPTCRQKIELCSTSA